MNPITQINDWLVKFRRMQSTNGPVVRDPRYVIVLTLNFIVLLFLLWQAHDLGTFDSLERPIFLLINSWPEYLAPIFIFFSAFGSLAFILFWITVAYLIGKRRLLFTTLIATTSAWLLSQTMKFFVDRGRPEDLIDTVRLLSGEPFTGNGFPSTHAAVAAAAITAIYYIINRQFRQYLLILGFFTGISRIYLGGHFPLDIAGGWALGAVVAAITCLAIGTRRKPIPRALLKRKLRDHGIAVTSVKQLRADARGSVPLTAVDKDKNEYFIKVFGKQEHAADWLFKAFRFFRYKSDANEEAYLSSKRNVEIEALGSLLARNAGVRTPKLLVLFQLDSRWVLVQERIDAKTLSSFKVIREKTLRDVWHQLKILHRANISHRDMRAENIMVDKKGLPHFIDFGFVEVAPDDVRKLMDIAQLLMALSIQVGVDRTLQAALRVIDSERMQEALAYIQYSVFSAETVKLAKQQEGLLDELREKLRKKLELDDAPEANIERINLPKLIGLVMFAGFLYVVIPQLEAFRGAFASLTSINAAWILPLIITSGLTYAAAAGVIYALTYRRIDYGTATLVQFAGSFVSKLVPGGVGSAALNIRYMQKNGISSGQSSGIVAAERVVGFLGLFILIVFLSLFQGQNITQNASISFDVQRLLIAAVVIFSAGIILYFFESLRRRVLGFIKEAYRRIRSLATSPKVLATATVSAILVTVFYVLCLYGSLQAVGITLGMTQIFIVYVTAMVAKGVSPTPGGLGALEIAMALALQGFGIAAADSYATVVVYRLATYWLPLPLGLAAYGYLRNKAAI